MLHIVTGIHKNGRLSIESFSVLVGFEALRLGVPNGYLVVMEIVLDFFDR